MRQDVGSSFLSRVLVSLMPTQDQMPRLDCPSTGAETLKLGPRVGPYSLFLRFRYPYTPLNRKGHPFIPRLLLGLVNPRP